MAPDDAENHLCIRDSLLPCPVPFCSSGVLGLYLVRIESPSENKSKYRRIVDSFGSFSWIRVHEKMNAHQRMVEARYD